MAVAWRVTLEHPNQYWRVQCSSFFAAVWTLKTFTQLFGSLILRVMLLMVNSNVWKQDPQSQQKAVAVRTGPNCNHFQERTSHHALILS